MHVLARLPLLPLAGLLALASTAAMAQGVFRHVGPDGRVTFSDQPPTGTAPAATPGGGPTAATGAELPFALRQTVQRYPVTLYTTTSCQPCDRGRDWLRERGIPFAEKTVNSNDDIDAFQKLSGGTQLPHLTVGPQALPGFSSPQWAQYLDAAGYPKVSALPRTYRAPAPSPLGNTPAPRGANATPPAPPVEAPAAPAPVAPSGPSSQNPAGIRF